MPISGVIIRFESASDPARARAGLECVPALELGATVEGAVVGVIDAGDYAGHDAALDRVAAAADVCAIDIVFHDFSDVHEFTRLPRRRGAR